MPKTPGITRGITMPCFQKSLSVNIFKILLSEFYFFTTCILIKENHQKSHLKKTSLLKNHLYLKKITFQMVTGRGFT